jgi:DNA-binding PadR family transcriptional regulator
MEKSSELEGVVLGMLWAMGPKTAYSIRQTFLKSPNPHWATSAGTIYPLVKRLHQRGLIRAERHATGKREGLMYTLTPNGMKALKRWIGPTPPPVATAVPIDPLRLRIRFMGALSEKERKVLFNAARRDLKKSLKWLESEGVKSRDEKDPFLYLAFRGSIMTNKSRLAFVDEAEKFSNASRKRK